MERKKFIRSLAALPLISVPSKLFGITSVNDTVCKTQRDVEGPFYKPDAPIRSVIETRGVPLQIAGTVFMRDCKTPVADAILDVWHCDDDGKYDMEGFKGRGQVRTDAGGRYSFITIFPPPYGSRPRHIHIKVRATGQQELTTQLYFKGDPNIRNDFARNAEEARVIALKSEHNLKKGTFNVYL
jgi:catechol 1,2-dioxygenase